MLELVCDLKDECANCTSLDYCTPDRIRNHISMIKKIKVEKKPVQIYFRSPTSADVTKLDPNVVIEYNKILPVDVVTCDSWDELDVLLNQKPNQLSIHANVFSLTDISCISETLKMLQKKLKILRLEIPIAIVVEKTTPRNIVVKAKESGIQGLIPYHGDWDSVDIMQGLDALTNRIQHWPEHIINQLPNDKLISVYFRKGWREYFKNCGEREMRIKLESGPDLPWQAKMCESWDELSEVLKLYPHQIIFHQDMLNLNATTLHEFVLMIDTLAKMTTSKSIPIGIAIEKTMPISMIKEFQKSNIYGIIPSAGDFGIDETHKGIEALFNRIPYWPKHILEQLPGNKKKTKAEIVDLTPRQHDVLKLIKERGASNKVIAKLLNISESTVKLHVGAILKKYNLKNRTQLALFTEK